MHKLMQESKTIQAKAKGYAFSWSDKIWVLDKDTKFNLSFIHELKNEDLKTGIILTLSYFAEVYSAKYVLNLFYNMKYFFDFTKNKNLLTTEQLINYKFYLTENGMWKLSLIKVFIKKWHFLGYPGIQKELIVLLDSWRIKGNLKGDMVKRKDPVFGPLSQIESLAFNEKAVQAYETKKIDRSELVISLLLSQTGRRPIQISHLKVGDIISTLNKKGEVIYFINIPRAKQSSRFRTKFKIFALKEELWSIIKLLVEETISRFQKEATINLNENDLAKLPLFPNWEEMLKITNYNDFIFLLDTDKFHVQNKVMSIIVKKVVKLEGLHSERTGQLLQITPRRFRYTIGTRAAKEGFGELVIAELLDHSDTQNAGVYIKNIPEHVERLDEAVGYQLAPFAQAFAGKLVDNEADSVRGNDRNSRIRTEEGNAVGNCGDFGFCGANVPIPCYTCIHFQPWVNGPHKEVYESLLSERKRIEQITGDITVTQILDRSIIAVAEVVMKCEARKEEITNSKKIQEK